MAKKEHLEILKQGVLAWNKWREDNPEILPDLSRAKLVRVNLNEPSSLDGATINMGDPSWEELLISGFYELAQSVKF